MDWLLLSFFSSLLLLLTVGRGGGTNISSSCRSIPISPLSLSSPSSRLFLLFVSSFPVTILRRHPSELYAYLLWALTALCFGLYKAPAQSQQSNCFRGASFFLFSFPLCVARLGPIISLPKSRAELKKQRREILTGEIEEIGKAKKHTREKSNTHLPDGSYP